MGLEVSFIRPHTCLISLTKNTNSKGVQRTRHSPVCLALRLTGRLTSSPKSGELRTPVSCKFVGGALCNAV